MSKYFYKGEKVKCLDIGDSIFLKVNDIYTVAEHNKNKLRLVEASKPYPHHNYNREKFISIKGEFYKDILNNEE